MSILRVSEVGVVDAGDNGGGHVFQTLEAVEGRVRLHGDALDLRVEFLRRRVVPMKVPVVPRPATKWVIWPSVWSQISLAVVR